MDQLDPRSQLWPESLQNECRGNSSRGILASGISCFDMVSEVLRRVLKMPYPPVAAGTVKPSIIGITGC